jgi:hypothetical protein
MWTKSSRVRQDALFLHLHMLLISLYMSMHETYKDKSQLLAARNGIVDKSTALKSGNFKIIVNML